MILRALDAVSTRHIEIVPIRVRIGRLRDFEATRQVGRLTIASILRSMALVACAALGFMALTSRIA